MSNQGNLFASLQILMLSYVNNYSHRAEQDLGLEASKLRHLKQVFTLNVR